jgi:hypothetical protein
VSDAGAELVFPAAMSLALLLVVGGREVDGPAIWTRGLTPLRKLLLLVDVLIESLCP